MCPRVVLSFTYFGDESLQNHTHTHNATTVRHKLGTADRFEAVIEGTQKALAVCV